MAKVDKDLSPKLQVFDINDLKEKFHTPDAIYYGVCALKDWKKGKCVSEKEYKNAVDSFLGNPINKEGSKK